MAGKLNRVYVDGLTRFETKEGGKSKEKAIIPTERVDDSAALMEKYSKKNLNAQNSKKNEFDKYCDIGRSLNAIKTEGKRKNIQLGHKHFNEKEIKDQQKCLDKNIQKLVEKERAREVDTRQMISKSADKFRGFHNQYPYKQKMTTQGQLQNLKNDYYHRERINTYNYPSPQPTQLKTYRDAYPTDRSHNHLNQKLKQRQRVISHKQDLFSKYPLPSMGLFNQQQINNNMKLVNYGLKQKQRQKQVLYSNRKTMDNKQIKVRQPIIDKHNIDIFKQIQERTRREKDKVYHHLQKQYAKDIQKGYQRQDMCYKKQIARDYSQQICKKSPNFLDKQYSHRKQTQDNLKYQRDSISPRPRAYQQYCNQYSKFSKDFNLGPLKPSQKIFSDKTNSNFNKQFQLLNNRFQKYQKQYQYAKIFPMKNYSYEENVYNKGVSTKREVRERIPNFGYRGSY